MEDLPSFVARGNSRYMRKPCLEKLKQTSFAYQQTNRSRKHILHFEFRCLCNTVERKSESGNTSKKGKFHRTNGSWFTEEKLCPVHCIAPVTNSSPLCPKSISLQWPVFPLKANVSSCRLCFKVIAKQFDKYLVEGKQFNTVLETHTPPFSPWENCSLYICKACRAKLKEHRELISKQRELENAIHVLNCGANEEQRCYQAKDHERPQTAEAESVFESFLALKSGGQKIAERFGVLGGSGCLWNTSSC